MWSLSRFVRFCRHPPENSGKLSETVRGQVLGAPSQGPFFAHTDLIGLSPSQSKSLCFLSSFDLQRDIPNLIGGSLFLLTSGVFYLQLKLFAYNGKLRLISTSIDCKQGSSTVSKETPTVS